MAKATISAASKKYTVNEGAKATSVFNFSQALDNSADVVVRLTGIGAQKDKDFGVLTYAVKDATGAVVHSGTFTKNTGTITLPKGSKSLELSSAIKADNIAGEQNESLVFSVAQAQSASKVLENSYYVTSTATIQESLSLAKISVDKAYYAARTTFPTDTTPYTFEESKADADGSASKPYEYAVGAFKLSTPLDKKAVISVKVEGQGVDLAEDTVDQTFEYQLNGTGSWTAVPTDNRITLTDQTTSFQLRVALKGDNVTEQQMEQLNFKVAQVSGNLKDSYYVNVVTDVVDREIASISFGPRQNSKDGTEEQDIFNMVNANSVPFEKNTIDSTVGPTTHNKNTVGYDTINDFGDGDVIKLQETVQRYSIREVTLADFTEDSTASAANNGKLFDTLGNLKYDENFPNGTGSILKIVENDTTVWLLIDTNANGIMDTRERGTGSAGGMDDKYDTLIKVTGNAPQGQTLTDLITGESFITE